MLKTALLIGSAALSLGTASAQVSQAPLTPAQAEAAWGDLEGFWGDLEGFWGDLDPFWGDLDPFWGDLDPFWGDLDGFWGDLDGFGGDAQVAWGDLDPFWGDLDPFWGDLDPFWDPTDDTVWTDEQRAEIERRFARMAEDAEAIFGDAVKARHGQGFDEALMEPLLARYGVDADLGGLTDLSSRDRARLFLDFYDTLMDHSGRDRVDWWMSATRWTPALAQDHGEGRKAVVGILDGRVKRSAQAGRRVRYRGGYGATHEDGLQHGAAVASLIAAPHDGVGIMGMAPRARLVNHNPFDETATAGWWDIAHGIADLRRQGAHVVNASLGVEDRVLSQEWAGVMLPYAWSDDLIVVKAAGNSGVEARDTFWWDARANDALILVGSVGVSGQISAFSNRPGEACMVSWGGCADGERVMDRFLVAPGEMILVDDGSGTGTTTRASGTSFAAPLVTGTIALMHSRWPWLEQHAAATSEIVLESARDLGAPGTDAVYGRGLLDTEAALSPLDFADLYQIKGRGRNQRRVALGDALLSEGGLRGFGKKGVLVAFEDAGDTYRDFVIPLEARTVNGRTRVAGRRRQDNQSHLFGRLADWSADRQGLVGTTETGTVQGRGHTLSFERTERADGQLVGESVYRFESGATLTLGHGAGLPTSLMFDRQLDAGGARLSGTAGLMSLSKGGAYAGASLPAGALGTLSFAMTRTEQDGSAMGFEDDPAFDQHDQDAYAALGTAVSVSRQAFGADLSVGYQRLSEANGVLGTQGTGALSLGRGATTDAVTAEVVLPRAMGIRLSLSGTSGRTRGGDQSGLIRVADEGVLSTAFAARADADGVFFRGDRVALTLSQPLTATGGALVVDGASVADRETGERVGTVTRIEADGAPVVAEASYRLRVLGERGELRALAGHDASTAESQLGLSLGVAF